MATKKDKYYRRADGLYEASRKINGRRVVFRGRTCKEVDQKILAYHEDGRRGRPFPVVADEWFAERESGVTRSTNNVYGYAVKRLKAAFPQRIGDIKPLDVTRYIRAFEKQGYADNTVSIELSVLKQIFTYAVLDSGDIDASPAAEVHKSKGLPRKKRSALTVEQENAVEAFRGDNWLFGMMLLYTGARRGELLALDWRDVDRKAGVVHITKKLSWASGNTPILEDHVKNYKAHDVPIFAPLEAVLPTDRVGRIFSNDKGEYLTASQLQKLWREYSEAVGLDGVTPHCFRHSFATFCFESGIPAASTASFLGDTVEVVEKVYMELREGKRLDDAAQVNAFLEARRAARMA